MQTRKPKYQEIVNWVMGNIQNGTFAKGDKLLSENELSVKFDLSRQTVRRAIEVLERQNLLTRVQGSGTYIGESIRSERRESYYNIAVVSTYVDSYIFPSVLKGIERGLSGAGYTMQVSFTGNRIERERDILDRILEKNHIDGLIVEPSKSALPNPNLHYYKKLMEQNVPILFFNSCYPELGLPHVSLDDVRVGKKAVEYLLRAGHQKIGGIFKCDDRQGHLRYFGYVQGIQEAGLKIDDRKVIWIDTTELKEMENWEDHLLRRIEGCTAVVCYNDEVAHTLCGICQKRGIRIPEDLSLISIDNSDLAVVGDVRLTSFPHPKEAQGRKLAENIIKMIANSYFDGGYLFDSEVIERESVRKIKAYNKKQDINNI